MVLSAETVARWFWSNDAELTFSRNSLPYTWSAAAVKPAHGTRNWPISTGAVTPMPVAGWTDSEKSCLKARTTSMGPSELFSWDQNVCYLSWFKDFGVFVRGI